MAVNPLPSGQAPIKPTITGQLSCSQQIRVIIYSLSSREKKTSTASSRRTAFIQIERGEVETLFLSEEHRNILSEREKEILRCIRKGLSSKEIAATLYISVNTVNRHRQNILEKLSVGNSIEACRAAELMKLL